MPPTSLVAFDRLFLTQGGAGTRQARVCLPWAMVFMAVGQFATWPTTKFQMAEGLYEHSLGQRP